MLVKAKVQVNSQASLLYAYRKRTLVCRTNFISSRVYHSAIFQSACLTKSLTAFQKAISQLGTHDFESVALNLISGKSHPQASLSACTISLLWKKLPNLTNPFSYTLILSLSLPLSMYSLWSQTSQHRVHGVPPWTTNPPCHPSGV